MYVLGSLLRGCIEVRVVRCFVFSPPSGVICLVVAVMYWLGWEMGAVEAISLSILVGSSVDYCLHLVEGYLLAGETASLLPGHNSVRESRFLS